MRAGGPRGLRGAWGVERGRFLPAAGLVGARGGGRAAATRGTAMGLSCFASKPLDQVIAAGTTPVRSTVFHYADDDSLRIAVSSRDGIDALYAPRRMLLDRLLVDLGGKVDVDGQLLAAAAISTFLKTGDRTLVANALGQGHVLQGLSRIPPFAVLDLQAPEI